MISILKGTLNGITLKLNNTAKNMKIKFNILNLSKPTSLYNKGMKVLIFSKRKQEYSKTGWHRGGDNILYYQNTFRRVSFTFS